ncbi:T9SS type A sorting domain-containing protein [candidate division GN15 bacterium]|nr:T9SS type A sorting domain-containing protein [candidate division GN15 bacterium]
MTGTLSASFDELQISSSTSPARFAQRNATAVRLATDEWLVAWEDDRLGASKVFWQRFDDLGNSVGPNAVAAGSASGADFVEPRLAVDTLGRIYCFWRDRTNGLILGTRYLSDFSEDLPVFLVNDTVQSSFAGPFDIGVFPDGQLVVVWENYAPLGNTIDVRLYSPSGNSLLGPATVNSDGGMANRWVPSVAVAPGSGFLVVWEDYRNGQADIYARQYSGSGVPVGEDLSLVPPPASSVPQYLPDVTFSEVSEYVVAWIDQRENRQAVFAQQFDGTLGLTGGNVPVSDSDTLTLDWGVSLASSPDGHTAVVWSKSSVDNGIAGAVLDATMGIAESPVTLNTALSGDRWSPVVAYSTTAPWGVAWTEVINTDEDIHWQEFGPFSAPLLPGEVVVNDDTRGAPSVDPAITNTTDWHSLIAWSDQRRDDGDIYVKAVSRTGVFFAGDRRVSNDTALNLQSEPAVHYGGDQALIVWVDSRPVQGVSGQRIMGRYSDAVSNLGMAEFQISDTGEVATKNSPEVALDQSGQALVAWIDRRSGFPEVWGKWIDADGHKPGDDFLISQDAADTAAASLSVVNAGTGTFAVVWLETGIEIPVIKGRTYSYLTLEQSFTYAPDIGTAQLRGVAADLRSDGNIALGFVYSGSGTTEVAHAVVSPIGAEIQAPHILTSVNTGQAEDVAVAVSDENYTTVAWVDHRDGKARLYRTILDPTGTPLDADVAVTSTTPEFVASPAVDASVGRTWYVWEDPRNEGINVWGKTEVFLPTDVDDDDPLVPSRVHLAQNYPNPFNPETRIAFWLPGPQNVRLDVLNTLGQHVVTLVDGEFSPGDHQVVWDGTDSEGERVASGIYFYRLTGELITQTRKMLLLK